MESLEQLEQILLDLRSRYNSGDKSVEAKLRATAARIEQIKLQKDLVQQISSPQSSIVKKVARALKRRSCCR